jgi:PKD repeat protein
MAVRFTANTQDFRRTTGLINYNNPYTWMAWVYFYSGPGTSYVNCLVIDAGGSFTNSDELSINDVDPFNFIVVGNVNFSFTTSGGTTVPAINTWYHVAMVRRSTTALDLYVNGLFEATATQDTSGRGAAATEMMVGQGYGGGINVNDARYFDLKIWDTNLSAEEVYLEYLSFAPRRFANIYNWCPTWPGNGERARDYSGNGRNWTETGTLTDESPAPISWGGRPIFLMPFVAGGVTARTATHILDTSLLRTQSATHSLDSTIQRTQSGIFVVDSTLLRTQTATHVLDATLQRTQSAVHLIDGTLLRTQTADHIIDATLLVTRSATHTADTVLLRTQSATHALDTTLLRTQSATHTVDTTLTVVQSASYTVDTTLLRTQAATQVVDTTLLRTQTANHTVDSTLQRTQSVSHELDAGALVRTQSATALIDTVLLRTQAADHALDSTLLRTQSATHTLDTILSAVGAQSATHILDTTLLRTQTANHTLDAALLVTRTATHTTDTTLQRTQDTTHSLDAGLLRTQSAIHLIDSTLLRTQSATHVLDTTLSSDVSSGVLVGEIQLSATLIMTVALLGRIRSEAGLRGEWQITTNLRGRL